MVHLLHRLYGVDTPGTVESLFLTEVTIVATISHRLHNKHLNWRGQWLYYVKPPNSTRPR